MPEKCFTYGYCVRVDAKHRNVLLQLSPLVAVDMTSGAINVVVSRLVCCSMCILYSPVDEKNEKRKKIVP